MAKRIRWLNNERVDVTDLAMATTGDTDAATNPSFAESELRRDNLRSVLANYPGICDGFRIEIADQTASPGLFTIHNAFAFDRAGKPVEDESEPDAQKSTTLPNINTQYFVEAEFVLTTSDTDSRAFWDQTYDNATDPSGDPREPGKEFNLTVATRVTATWKIVTPISTTGFEISKAGGSPNSTKIPIATLQTDAAGKITGLWVATAPARTVVQDSVAIGAASIKVHNSRIFPDAFDLRIVSMVAGVAVNDDLSVTANDRENGILTLAGPTPTTANHFAGDVVYDRTVNAPQFLGEDTSFTLPSTGSRDARPRLFRGNESAGFAALRDPTSNLALTDTQIRSLKDEVDALSATIRDMKFGGFIDPIKTAPADKGIGQYTQTAFSVAPHWYDRAGSIAGGKAITVSVGDGVLSFGDYNTHADCYPTPRDAIQAAVDKIAASAATSGVLYIKRSTNPYDIANTTVTITGMTKRLTICGDGEMSNLRLTGTAPVFTLAGSSNVHFENIKLSRNAGTGSYCVAAGAGSTVTGAMCAIDGVFSAGTLTVDFNKVTLLASAGGNGIALAATPLVGSIRNSVVGTTVNANTSFAVSLGAASGLTVQNTNMATVGAGIWAAVSVGTGCTLTMDGVTMISSSANLSWTGVYVPSGATEVNLSRCSAFGVGAYGLISATDLTRANISNCNALAYSANWGCISLDGDAVGKSYTIRDCTITQAASNGAKVGKAITTKATDGVCIENVKVVNADGAVYMWGATAANTTIRGLRVSNATATCGDYGVKIVPDVLTSCTVDDCEITGLDNSAIAAIHGVLISPVTSGEAVSITNNRIHGIGIDTCGECHGVRVIGNIIGVTVDDNTIGSASALSLNSSTTTTAISLMDDGANGPRSVSIDGNKLLNIAGLGNVHGISVATYTALSISNNKIRIIGTSASTGVVNGIYFGWDSAVVFQQDNATITSNVIYVIENSGAITCSGIYGCIGVGRTAIGLNSISNVKSGANGGAGIWLNAQVVGTNYVNNVVINGNVIVPSNLALYKFDLGITLTGLQAADVESQFVISNNIIGAFTASGISVTANPGDTLDDLTISGNTIRTNLSCARGIFVPTITGFSISGNTVRLNGGAGSNQDGILVGGATPATDGAISGNRVYVNTPAAGHYGISATGNGIDVSGNSVNTQNVRGIFATSATRSFVGQNILNTGGGGYGVLAAGGSSDKASTTQTYAADGNYLNMDL